MLGHVRVGANQQLLPVAHAGVAGPDLLARHYQLVAVDDGFGAQAGQVGPGARLGEALAPQRLTAQNLGQMVRLLLFGGTRYKRRPSVGQPDEPGIHGW